MKFKSVLICLLLSLIFMLCGCYEFESILQPEEVDPAGAFDITISITASPYHYIDPSQSYYSIMLPTGWQPSDSLAYTGTDSGMYYFSLAHADTMEMQDPAIDGYTWWTFVSDTIFDLGRRNLAFSFNQTIQTSTETGIYFIDYRLGYSRDENYSWAEANSNPIWVGIEPFPLEGDLYVSVDGSDANTGLVAEAPLQTISAALERASADSANPRNIFIAGGEYKNSTNGERFPLYPPDYLSLIGDASADVVLDAEGTARVLGIGGPGQVSLSNLILTGGYESQGGGLLCNNSNLTLSNVTITDNSAYEGGGLYSSNSNLTFSTENRCNIYSNSVLGSGGGTDIFSDAFMEVIVDTFTVMQPTDYYATPLDKYSFDILHAIREQVKADLYVSAEGSNSNDGLTQQTALQTIQYAKSIILADSENPRTIHLKNGHYSPSTTGEIFPIDLSSYVSLTGESELGVILDADSTSKVMKFENTDGSSISNLTITGGLGSFDWSGGGVSCNNSILYLESVTIRDNTGDASGRKGGGIYCLESDLRLKDVNISNNVASYGGGIYCETSTLNLNNVVISNNISYSSGGGINIEYSSGRLANVTIKDNSAINWGSGGGMWIQGCGPGLILDSLLIARNSGQSGGGIEFFSSHNPILTNVSIVGNHAESWGGGISLDCSEASLTNVTIAGNSASRGSGIALAMESSLDLRQSIVWNWSSDEVFFNQYWGPHAIHLTYCDVKGGKDGIITNDNGNIYWNEGNIDSDPLFCDVGELDFHLADNSPCVGAGLRGSNLGALGVGCSLPVDIVRDQELPSEYALAQNYPNPFNPTTTISYDLPEQSSVKLTVFDIRGQELVTLQETTEPAGNYQLQWNGMDRLGNPVSTGVYFCRLTAGDFSKTIKMLMIK